MRIVQVVHDFVPETWAGVEIITYNLSVSLINRGYEVFVFCRGWNLKTEPYALVDEVLDGIQVRRVNFGYEGKMARELHRNDQVNAAFERYLTQVQPDLVHFHHLLYLSTDLVSIAYDAGIPTIVTLNNYWFRCPWGSLLNWADQLCQAEVGLGCLSCVWPDRFSRKRKIYPWRLFNPLLSTWYRYAGRVPLVGAEMNSRLASLAMWKADFLRLFELADLIHAPSLFIEGKLVEFGVSPEKIVMIETAAVPPAPGPMHKTRNNGRIRFGIMGTHFMKGLRVLAEAFAATPAEQAELKIYGQIADQRYFDRAMQLAGGADVKYCGVYHYSQLFDIFTDIDVLVVPSIWYENCPTVIREAFRTETPVITSDIGGMAEAVRDDVDGLLFRANDPYDLRAKLLKIITNPELIDQLRRNIRPPQTWENYADRIEVLYHRLINSKEAASPV